MYFTEERIHRILTELSRYIYPDSEPVEDYFMKQSISHNIEETVTDTEGWKRFLPEDRWGGRDKHFWFKAQIEIPHRFMGKTVVYEVRTGREGDWDALNPQFLVYVNNKLVQGLDVNHRKIILSEKASDAEVFNIALYAYSGMKEGLVELHSSIRVQDREVQKLYYDLKVPLEVAKLLDREDKRKIDILNYLNDAVNLLDLRKPFSQCFYESVAKAESFMEQEFYEKYCGNEDIIANCVGHTHIDVAWLWTIAQTREKAARSFSTVLNLMKQYPEYIFMSSQPQLYKFIKEDHPEIYKEIKKRAAEGRWEPEGAMWLEADCNVSSGESLIRQVLFGTRFFEQEFGVKNKILWLPDVFGYSAALPQILIKSGIKYFMTTKISWNEYNKVPYDTFMWRGIDGTEILTHFITTQNFDPQQKSHYTTYNGNLIPAQVLGAWQRYQQKDINNEVLISYGYGDGGGGPTKEMLENAARLSRGIPGCPKVRLGNSIDFFRNLENKVSGKRRLPKWVGELYLEYHRGTYTSMAKNKKYNRQCEFLYQDVELFSAMNHAISTNAGYPREEINSGWEIILLNQFHDILPGSSIKEVYEDSKKQYEEIIDKGRELVEKAVGGIAANINLSEESVIIFNQLSFNRSDVVEIELPEGFEDVEIFDADGRRVNSQLVKVSGRNVNHDGVKVLFFACDVPAKGYKAFRIEKKAVDTVPFQSSCSETSDNMADIPDRLLSNRFFDIKFDGDYNITSIYDKKNSREVLKSGERANVLCAFEDKPHNFDAWDVNIYYQEKMWEINDVEEARLIENGPVRNTLRIRRKFMDSVIEQDVCIYNEIPRIDFMSQIDWKERQILLKAAFPVDIHTDKATYEIQYGNVERPTHWNTSWDYARFEVCAHKWADLSEDNYGVSLLNDCKYGHDIKDGLMRLTLLKSAVEPNIDADREFHEFCYSLYPHGGDWKKAETVQMAYSLNCPMYTKIEEPHEGSLPPQLSLLSMDRGNVIAEVVKKAEDSNDMIIRVYEYHNRRTEVTLSFFKDLSGAWECDLMENSLSQLEFKGASFKFEIKPYEIKTFRLCT